MLLPLWFIVRVIGPAVLGSAALALSAVILRDTVGGRDSATRAAVGELRPLGREIVAAGLFAGMISLALVVFFRGLGLLLLPLAYGPPILIQIIAVEGTPLQTAWPRMRGLMRGNWVRVLVTLLTIVLAISMFAALLLATVYAATETVGEIPRAALLSTLQALLVGVTLPYLAAAQFVTYSGLAERADAS